MQWMTADENPAFVIFVAGSRTRMWPLRGNDGHRPLALTQTPIYDLSRAVKHCGDN